MTDWQRLEQVVKWTGLSTNAFAVSIGLKRSENLYQIKRGRHGISKDLAEMIARKYPDINRAWLLTGQGEMMLVRLEKGRERFLVREDEGIPYYNIDISRIAQAAPEASGGGLCGMVPACYINIPNFGLCDLAASSFGESMSPDIPAGAIVALKEVGLPSFLPGEAYMVVTPNFAVLRYVRWADYKQGKIKLIPANSQAYDEMIIQSEEILRLYLVKGVIISKVI